jgi:HD-GYP domain-containing protein (c-di-GMP phosphodiesterase class II)
MTSEQSYKATLSAEEALAELEACAGSQFDPELVRAFRELVAEGDSAPR